MTYKNALFWLSVIAAVGGIVSSIIGDADAAIIGYVLAILTRMDYYHAA